MTITTPTPLAVLGPRVTSLVRPVWDELNRDQQAGVVRLLENLGGESEHALNVITDKLAGYLERNAARTRSRTPQVIDEPIPASRPASGWSAVCDECGGWRIVRSSRPVARFCDRCEGRRRAAEQAARQKAREKAAA